MKLTKDIFSYERERRKQDGQQKTELKNRILAIPDNPKAKSFGRGFVVKFSDLGNNWSVEHHDFGAQRNILAEVVDKSDSPLNALLKLRTALRKRRIVSGNVTVPLHRDLVVALKKMLAA